MIYNIGEDGYSQRRQQHGTLVSVGDVVEWLTTNNTYDTDQLHGTPVNVGELAEWPNIVSTIGTDH